MKPDLIITRTRDRQNCIVLDTKWKLLDSTKSNSKDKYGLSQADFYQLFAYGQFYLQGTGKLVLIYPKTDKFNQNLNPFIFNHQVNNGRTLTLSVLPYDLEANQLIGMDLNNLP